MTSGNRLIIAPKGFGKCMIGQTAAQVMLTRGVRRVLIVAPLKVVQLTWGTEHKIWEHLKAPALCIGDERERRAAVAGTCNIVVVNNDNLAWLLHEYPGEFDGMIIDEISKYKSVSTAGVKRIRKYRKQFKWVCGMSATPAAEAGVDLYSQVGIVDNWTALGGNQDKFRRSYFFPTDYEQRNWSLLPGMGTHLADAIKGVVYMADSQGYEDSLTELYDVTVPVVLPPIARTAYQEMCKDMISGEIEAPNAAVKMGKLQQITQGAAYASDGEIIWLHEAKLQALMSLLIRINEPTIIAYQFKFECAYLENLGIPYLARDPIGLEAAWNNGELKWLAVHPQSAGHGLNLQRGGHNLVMLGPIWSADQHDQLAGRLRRRGQVSDVYRYTIVALDTVDELIMDRVVGKERQEGELMRHLAASCGTISGTP